MKRLLISFNVLAILVCAKPPEKPIDIYYSSNKQVNDAEINKDKNSTDGFLEGGGEKKISITSPTNKFQANETGYFLGDFEVLKVGNKSKGYFYAFGGREDRAAELFEGGVQYSDGSGVRGFVDTAHTKDDGEYRANASGSSKKHLRVGDEGRLYEEGQRISSSAGSSHEVSPDALNSATSMDGYRNTIHTFDDNALRVHQNGAFIKGKTAVFDIEQNTISELMRGEVGKQIIVDKGPFYVDVSDTAGIVEAQYTLDDLTALRAWVLGTDAADIKLNILEMLDYTP